MLGDLDVLLLRSHTGGLCQRLLQAGGRFEILHLAADEAGEMVVAPGEVLRQLEAAGSSAPATPRTTPTSMSAVTLRWALDCGTSGCSATRSGTVKGRAAVERASTRRRRAGV